LPLSFASIAFKTNPLSAILFKLLFTTKITFKKVANKFGW